MKNIVYPLSSIAGVVVALSGVFSLPFFLFYSALLCLAVLFVWFFHDARMRTIIFLVALFVASLLRGSSAPPHSEATISQSSFTVNAIVVQAPIVRGSTQILTLKSDTDAAMRFTAFTNVHPLYAYGDWLAVECAKSDGATCLSSTIHRLGQGRGSRVLAVLFAIKERLVRGLTEVLPEPHASFAAALLLGERAAMPAELRDAFQITGTTHIVAVSGMHIVILGEIIKIVLGWFAISVRLRRVATVLFLVFFTAMIGAPASAVRGLLFGLLLLFAEGSGRPRQMSVALSTTCAALLLWRPSLLLDLGFQLSFLAVIGIVYGVPIVTHAMRKWMPKHPFARGVATMAIVTFSATLATAPLLAGVFGRVSLISLVANLLIVPIVEAATILTLLVALLSLLHVLIALPFGIVLFMVLDTMMVIARLLAKIPGASLDVAPPSSLVLFALYGAFFAALFYLWSRMTPWERNFSESTSSSS